jgi:hypothetical protein
MEDIETNGNTLTQLKSIQFLPVLPKPEQWKWSWAGNLQFHDFRHLSQCLPYGQLDTEQVVGTYQVHKTNK